MGRPLRLRTTTVVLAVLSCLPVRHVGAAPPSPTPRPPTAAGERKDFDARAARLEIGQRIPAILEVLAASPGNAVASFGLTRPDFLDSLLRTLGPEGRAVSIHRNYGSYLAELESAARRGGRVESIFAADGDAHLEPGSVAIVVAQEVDGFYLREQDLWRQAWQALQPDGRLVLIRFPPMGPRPGTAAPKAATTKTPPSAFAERLAANRAVVQMENSGFRWIETPKILTHWVVEVYRRVEMPPAAPAGAIKVPLVVEDR